MSSVKVETVVTITRNSEAVSQIARSHSQSAQNEIYDSEIHLAPNAAPVWVPVWDPTVWTGFPVVAFKMMAIFVDIDGGDNETYAAEFIYLEETVNEGDVNEELHAFKLFVGQQHIVQSNVSYDNHGAAADTNASLSVINKVAAKNPQVDTGKPDVVLRLLMLDDS